MIQSDIGVNISGYMHIICHKGTKLPCEAELIVKPASGEAELSLYQGPHAYTYENEFIGSMQLFNLEGAFTIKFVIEDTIKVQIEDLLNEFEYNHSDLGEPNAEDIANRENEEARQAYIVYIRETLSTLEEIRDKIEPYIIQRVLRAGSITEIKDVTKLEFEMAQAETEDWLNPLMKKISSSWQSH
jgi:hypothetical protein